MPGQQRSITSFFASKSSGPAGSASRSLQSKSPKASHWSPKKPESKAVAAVDTDEDPKDDSDVAMTGNKEPEEISSPVKRAKRKRAVIIDSDDEDEGDAKENKSVDEESNNESGKEESKDEQGDENEDSDQQDKREKSKEKLTNTKTKEKEDRSKKAKGGKVSPVSKKRCNRGQDGDSADEKDSKTKTSSYSAQTKKEGKLASIFSTVKSAKNSDKDTKTDTSASTSDFGENLKKSRYHPINDACWKKGAPMPFMALAEAFSAIEDTKGRLRMTEILANFFRSQLVLSPSSLLPSIYLCLNRLAPATEGLESGVGDFILQKAIAQATGRNVKQIREQVAKLGDLGAVAESAKATQTTMFKPAPLELEIVFKRLKEIAGMSGKAVVEQKVGKIQGLLVACRDKEAKYLIRSLAGKLRIGLAEQSLLQALAQACVMTPPPISSVGDKDIMKYKDINAEGFKERLEKEALKLKTAYCECPNYDLVVPALLEGGLDGVVAKCKLTPGLPLKPMLAHPTKGIEEVLSRFENLKFTCEWKYDGERAQIHLLENGDIRIFSRNQENHTSKYPDVISRLKSCFKDDKKVESCVLDSEAVAFDKEKKSILPFQVLSTRKRKDATESNIKVQVCLFAFDLLYLNGEPLVKKSLRERRELLREHFKEVQDEFKFAKAKDAETIEAMQEALDESIEDKCEGLMVKTLDADATYEIARRSRNWLKLKKDYLDAVGDTLDLVVIGGYFGKGKRTGSYGGFLLACYEPETEVYQSICKIGTGFSDADLSTHAEFFKNVTLDKQKDYYRCDASSLKPDVWFDAVQVWEVKAADLSLSPVHKAAEGLVAENKGVSLRFPRFVRVRDDKKPEDATDAAQVAEMYRAQMRETKKKQGGNVKEDDFDF